MIGPVDAGPVFFGPVAMFAPRFMLAHPTVDAPTDTTPCGARSGP
jgi:hypothetical protein